MNFKEFLNEKDKKEYTIKLPLVAENGKLRKTLMVVGEGDTVNFKPGTKPAKGKNKYNVFSGELGKKKGNIVQINAAEEGGFWYNINNLYVNVSDLRGEEIADLFLNEETVNEDATFDLLKSMGKEHLAKDLDKIDKAASKTIATAMSKGGVASIDKLVKQEMPKILKQMKRLGLSDSEIAMLMK